MWFLKINVCLGSEFKAIALPSFVALLDFKRITSICMQSLLQLGPACLPDKRLRSRARPCVWGLWAAELGARWAARDHSVGGQEGNLGNRDKKLRIFF